MLKRSWIGPAFAGLFALSCSLVTAAELAHPDHAEFDATLEASYRAKNAHWPIALNFTYPFARDATSAAWLLDAVNQEGMVVRSWKGITPLQARHARVELVWDGRGESGAQLADGYYRLRLRATPTVDVASDSRASIDQRIASAFASFPYEIEEQALDVIVGEVEPARVATMLPLGVGASSTDALAPHAKSAPAPGSLPYTLYYGNLHSQTNHSDGGVPLASCKGAENPQAGVYGPTDAYTMMQNQAGGDFLLTSEHNHMFDGSTGTNASANPTTAINLFHSGLQLASNYRAAHASFLALYGLEWGVISNGGHLNILNVDALAEWESNSSGQLIGEVNTPKSNYASLYQSMNQHGWIGMFNHPATSGQFVIGGTALAYDATGNDVMVLAEVLNSSAFSTNTTQTETSRSSYVGAWNILLERGYHVAPASDQDNHCANWGLSFTNRTGVLMPTGTALTPANFYDALRARRTFATEDKAGQVVLTANNHVMGETFANSGALTLTANYASTNGQTVQRLQFFEGVPGSNGTVAQLTEGNGSYTFTPANGSHFYYALITQANGLRLWSAPVWVNQAASGDTTPPTVSAGESGSSGTITLSATASDNVGVTLVEFSVDGVLKGSDAGSPYSVTLNSATLANGSHSLTAKAYDAAGNSKTSTAVSFNVTNATPDTTPPTVSASESGTSGSITLSSTASDNIGVTKVEFSIDGALKATDTTSPYSVTLDSATLANGSHSLAAKAYDAAGNSATSIAVAFSINNSGTPVERITNGGFESGTGSWTASSGVITSDSTYPAHAGTWKAWLDGYGSAHTDSAYQSVAIPATATIATLSFWVRVDSDETSTTAAYDTLKAQLRNSGNTVLATLATYSNLDKGSSYVQHTFDVSAYKGQSVRVYFEGTEGSQIATSFLIDDVSLKTQ
ncbi:MAG: Ig-like domain-containing protein [Dokdonella sp.]